MIASQAKKGETSITGKGHRRRKCLEGEIACFSVTRKALKYAEGREWRGGQRGHVKEALLIILGFVFCWFLL